MGYGSSSSGMFSGSGYSSSAGSCSGSSLPRYQAPPTTSCGGNQVVTHHQTCASPTPFFGGYVTSNYPSQPRHQIITHHVEDRDIICMPCVIL